LLYPGIDVGFGWGAGIDLGLYFGGWGGWGWGGWGWEPNWYGGGLFLNNSFFHRYGFQHFHGNEALGRSEWSHNPEHRLGVPYGNARVANQFGGRAAGGFAGGRTGAGFAANARSGRQAAAPAQRPGSPGFEQRGYAGNNSAFGGYHSGAATRMQSDHGFSSMGAGRTSGGGGGMRGGGGGGFGGGGGMRGGGGGGGHAGGGGRR
jgi:hypothetical protein